MASSLLGSVSSGSPAVYSASDVRATKVMSAQTLISQNSANSSVAGSVLQFVTPQSSDGTAVVAGVKQWEYDLQTTQSGGAGGATGNDLRLIAYDNSGLNPLVAMTATRSTGEVAFPQGATIPTLDGNVEVTGTLQVDTGLTVVAGGALVSAGNITASAGDIVASLGDLVATVGDITASAGDITASAGNITASLGDLVATAGDITASAGTVSGATVSASALIGPTGTGVFFGDFQTGAGVRNQCGIVACAAGTNAFNAAPLFSGLKATSVVIASVTGAQPLVSAGGDVLALSVVPSNNTLTIDFYDGAGAQTAPTAAVDVAYFIAAY